MHAAMRRHLPLERRDERDPEPLRDVGERGGLSLRFDPRPVGSSLAPKSFADRHSLEARWLTFGELARLPLRHPEVLELFALSARVAPEPDLTQVDLPMSAHLVD